MKKMNVELEVVTISASDVICTSTGSGSEKPIETPGM